MKAKKFDKIYVFYPGVMKIFTNTTERAGIKLKRQVDLNLSRATELTKQEAINRVKNGIELVKISDMM